MTRKKDQQDKHKARLVQFTIDHSAEPAFWIGPDARFIYVNQAACDFLGYTHEALLGLTVHDINPDLPDKNWADYWQLIKQKGGHTFEALHKSSTGQLFPVEIRVNYVQFEGREYHCAFVHDLTEHKQCEQERLRIESQMQNVQKLESLGVLAGGIAHDFNNLLMAILGNADLAMIALSANSPVRRYVEEISLASKRAAELCRQMLAYSGKGSMIVARHDLAAILGEMEQMLAVSVSKKIMLRYHFDADIPEVMVDENQIQQVALNLITNAAESIGEKKGDITVSIGTMHCDRNYFDQCHLNQHLPDGEYVFLEVADTGPGMTPQTRERIFEPFFTTKFVGRGLGLAAVLGIVRSHGGAIRVDSAPGKGTSIRILLPALDAVEDDLDLKASTAASVPGRTSILLIDDDPHVRQVSAEMLKLMGYDVITAPTGPQGIDLYGKYHQILRCVILDITVPDLTGLETFDDLWRLDQDVTVILSSGYAEKEVMQSFVGRKFTGFLQKPYTMEKLRDALHQALSAPSE